jgi:hypothetical protein
MDLYVEFFAIVEGFGQKGVRYALIGGLSLAFHGRPRFTRDIDLLVHPDDMAATKDALSDLDYKQSAPAWTFKDSELSLHRFLKVAGEDELPVDLIVAEAHHIGVIHRALHAASHAGPVPVARKEDIIRMKRVRGPAYGVSKRPDLAGRL